MNGLCIAPIVEGYGEVGCLRILLQRISLELFGVEYVNVLTPIRQPRQKLTKDEHLQKAVRLALGKLAHADQPSRRSLVLLLLDADEDCPAELAPALLRSAQAVHTSAEISCVLAKVEYETWFVAAADSLREYLELPPSAPLPTSPEETRKGKGWIQQYFRGTRYSETQDQPALTSKMDLSLCRSQSPSFDKLCRELEARLV